MIRKLFVIFAIFHQCKYDYQDLFNQFDKHADGFKNHIIRDHHLWNYIYYLVYVVDKDSTDRNGIESEIAEKVIINNYFFLVCRWGLILASD